MGNRRVGAERPSLVFDGWVGERPMEIARAINHAVIATEWIARVILMLALMLVLYYAADRDPPFRLVSTQPASGQAGEFITIRGKAERDVSRGCNAEFSRYMFDSAGVRFDLGHSQASAKTISQMELRQPGALVIAFRIPQSAAPGPASLQTTLQYRCNRVHAFWPIDITIDMPFTVLP